MCAQSYTVLASELPSYLYLFNKNKINHIYKENQCAMG